jgi:hypothetical protein
VAFIAGALSVAGAAAVVTVAVLEVLRVVDGHLSRGHQSG